VASPSAYRRQLIDAGTLSVSARRDIAAKLGLPILALDDAGARAAVRHIEQGEHGAKLMLMPAGLADWQEAAIAARERRRST